MPSASFGWLAAGIEAPASATLVAMSEDRTVDAPAPVSVRR
jgi:hypothetical protein